MGRVMCGGSGLWLDVIRSKYQGWQNLESLGKKYSIFAMEGFGKMCKGISQLGWFDSNVL